MRDGGRSIGIADFDKLAQVPSCLFPTPYIFKWFLQRFVTLGNMPADLPNIERLVEYEIQKHGPGISPARLVIPPFYLFLHRNARMDENARRQSILSAACHIRSLKPGRTSIFFSSALILSPFSPLPAGSGCHSQDHRRPQVPNF